MSYQYRPNMSQNKKILAIKQKNKYNLLLLYNDVKKTIKKTIQFIGFKLFNFHYDLMCVVY